jgi:hypothetical protein
MDRIQRCAATSAPLPPVPPGTLARSFRWLTLKARSMAKTTACVPIRAWPALSKLKPFFDRVRPRDPGQQLADHRRRGLADPRLPGRGRQVAARAARPDHRQPVGGLDPAQMGLGPVHAATPILQRIGLGSTTSTSGKSTKPSPRRCLAVSPPGNRTSTAVSSSACRGRFGSLSARVSTSTAARLPSVTRSALPARASSCTCCRPACGPGNARHRRDLHWRWSGRGDAG